VDDATLSQEKVHITGYPGDKGLKQMWTMSHILKTTKTEQFYYEIDTAGGQSGSPIWINKWGMPLILGVHTLGANSINSGVRLSERKFTNFLVRVISETYNLDTVPTIALAALSIAPSSGGQPTSTITSPLMAKATTTPQSTVAPIVSSPIATQTTLTLQPTPFSFEEWRKGLLSRQEPWAKTLWNQCTSEDIIKLQLNNYNIGEEGAQALASGHLTALTKLNLNYTSTGDSGAQILASGNLTDLKQLNLKNNKIGATGKEALRRKYPKANITF
jgi:hypothetical protein